MLSIILLGSLLSLVSPVFINVWSQDNLGLTKERMILLLGLLVITLLFQVLATVAREKHAENCNIANLTSMMNRYFRLKYDEINKQGAKNLVEKMGMAVNSMYLYLTGDSARIWASRIIVGVILILSLLQNWIIAVIMAVMVPINYFAYKGLNQKLVQKRKTLQEESAQGWAEITSFMENTDYLKQGANHEALIKQMEPSIKKVYGSMAKVNAFGQGMSGLIGGVNQIVQVMILIFLVYGFVLRQINPLTIVQFVILLPLFFSNINIISSGHISTKEVALANQFVGDLKSGEELNGNIPCEAIEKVAFNINTFTLNGKVLEKKVEGEFLKGDIVAIYGQEGAGKTALAQLLPKFRKSGGITINEKAIMELENESLRSRIEYVPSKAPIIGASLRENLFYNIPWTTKREEAFRKEKLLQPLLQKITMDTWIENEGRNLTEDEKQCISLTRALYNETDLMILDDVMKNTSEQSNSDIIKRIKKASEEKVIFVFSTKPLPKDFANKAIHL